MVQAIATSTAIGIDLGTVDSTMAYWDHINGKPKIIMSSNGNSKTPSYVAWTQPKPNSNYKTEQLIGDPAKTQKLINPENTVYEIKSLIGQMYDSPEI